MRSSTSFVHRWYSLASTVTLVAGLAVAGCASDPAEEPGGDGSGSAEPPSPVILERVDGTIVDRAGTPLAGKIVMIGAQSTTTDADGHFSLTNVEAPYDVLVTQTGSSFVSSYVSLSSATPTIAVLEWLSNREATISGSVSTTKDTGESMMLGVTTPFSNESWSSVEFPAFTGTYARWWGATSTTATMLALTYKKAPDGSPLTYTALGVSSTPVVAGQTASGITMSMQDPAEATLGGHVVLPTGAQDVAVGAFANAGGANVMLFDRVTTSDFSFVVPSGAGLTSGLVASTSTDAGYSFRFIQKLAPGAQDVELVMPKPAMLVSPAPGSTSVKPGDTLTWTDDAAKYFIVEVAQHDPVTKTWPLDVRILTTGHSLTIPDVSALGLAWDPHRETTVWISAFDIEQTHEEVLAHSLDNIMDKVFGNGGIPEISGAFTVDNDGFWFPAAP